MSINARLRAALMNIALGRTALPQEFTLGLPEPQTEITIWLRGVGVNRDVTNHVSTACAEPLTICIGFEEGTYLSPKDCSNLTLVFSERDGRRRVLGKIGLEHKRTLSAPRTELLFFEPRSSSNFCLPKARLALHYLLHAYRQWRRDNTQGIRMTFLERRASMVTFIRPHPILLVSVGDRDNGNIFPMNLCGDLGSGYFGFALRTERVAGTLVERFGRVALSSLPESEGYLAYRMAHNHTMESIDWSQLPFATGTSKAFHLPIPEFAQRVKELEIVTSIAIGSHRFFVARIVGDEKIADGPGFCSIHGFYQAWRLKQSNNRASDFAPALARDAFHKRERHVAKS
jgi:flavin reductase (DIM6/NTAB) family NADH-FMN oxidoreductase RutF